jgi:FR47-like protein
MSWKLTGDVGEFAKEAGPMLASRPDENTVALTVTAGALSSPTGPAPGSVFGWWTEDSEVTGALLCTPPYPLLLAVVPSAGEADLLDELDHWGLTVTALAGEVGPVERMAARWCRKFGGSSSIEMSQRLYRLQDLREPSVPGAAQLATDVDADLVTSWFHDFAAEAEPHSPPAGDVVRVRVTAGLVWLWLDASGRPVSMAARNPTAAGVARVGPVFTPPEDRRQGYGAAVTAACSRAGLAEGAEQIVLFTDLANPTSNSVYQQIGFRPQSDRLIVQLHPGSVT